VIREVAGWAEVKGVSVSGRQFRTKLDVSRRVIHGDVVECRGITGNGVKVGLIEGPGGRVATGPVGAGG
jgi:hypothetical protein